MHLNRGAVGGGHGDGATDGMQLRRRERVLAAQLHELLFPPTSASPTGGFGASSSSELCASGEHGSSLMVKAPGGNQRRVRGSKGVRECERRHQEEQEHRGAGGCSAAIKATPSRRKKQGTTATTTFVTTVPGFDGYSWRKYGQKQIEGAQYSRYSLRIRLEQVQ